MRCVHRPGRSTLHAEWRELEGELTVFVPPADSCELWILRLTNRGDSRRELELRLGQTWCLCQFGQHTAEDGIPYVTLPGGDLRTAVGPNTITAHAADRGLPFPLHAFFESPEAIAADCRDAVELRDGRRLCFKVCELTCRVELPAKGTAEIHVASGADADKDRYEATQQKFLRPEAFVSELANIEARWRERIESIHCATPAPDLDRFLNVWLKNQLHLTFHFVRSGTFGYRDTLQDTWGCALLDPAACRKRLAEALRHLKTDGTAPRCYNPWGGEHDLRRYMDSGTWIPLALTGYIKETGDFGFLDEPRGFLDSDQTDTVEGHVWRALDVLHRHRGLHGACLTGDGDWNDALEGISRDGDAVSIWLTIALYHAQRLMAELYDRIGKRDKRDELTRRAETLRRVVEEHGWDGDWYVYGFTGSGKPIGSHANREGRIHLNAQSWAVFTGLASPERARTAMASVEQHLATPFGPALLDPPYVEEGDEVGRIARLEPGTFENGSVYQHAVAFKIFADARIGNAEKALDTFLRVLPTHPENFDRRRTSEPYCTGNFYCGPAHARAGQNFFTWFTGNAAWLLRAGFEEILGVRADYDGLRVTPCVPRNWKGYAVRRRFRGTVYDFTFERTGEALRIEIDGDPVPDNLVRPTGKPRSAVRVVY